jgi:hypothetical protein
MDTAYVPAFAALAGSAIGGLTSFASAWLTQHDRDRVKRLSEEKTRRQKLYKQFIDEASKLYGTRWSTIRRRSRHWSVSTR